MSSRMSILLRDLDSTLKEFDTGAAGQPTKTPSARKGVLGHGAEDDSEDILNQYDHEDDFDILNQYDDTVEEPEALKEQNPPKPLINTPPPLSMPRHTPRPPTSAMAIARAKQLPPTPPQHHLRDPRAFPMPSPTLPPSTQVTNGFHVGESEFVAPVTRNNSSPDSMPLTSVRPAEPVDVAVLREQLERAKFVRNCTKKALPTTR
ncbi:hypothetical protein BC830DRAFT_516442 [Chytriomyces sp. MP71]|nr:hypothetical protein BC830DRAFT_516442 [Chytriomyces sp. MP71]